MNKALFLDRDGTINVDLGYVYQIDDFHFIDGIIDLCLCAQEKGYLIIVITNQSGIARGYYTESDYEKLSQHMIAQFAQAGVSICDIYHCPHLSGEDRKPQAGMFFKAQKEHQIDMARSLSLGDKQRDLVAAKAAGVGTNILFTGTYQSIKEKL